MLKNILRVLLIVVTFLVLAFVGLIFLVNPNQFRSAIEQAVLESTGYQLTIAGDLDLRFRPYVGLTLNDVRLRNPAAPQELASTSVVSLRVDPGLLLQGELLISEFRADDFHVNWYTAADGNNIWNLQAPGSSTPVGSGLSTRNPTQAANNSSTVTRPSNIRASFERILVNNASIDIQDVSSGTRYGIDDLNLESRNLNFQGQRFPIELNFNFLNDGISTPMAIGLRSNVALNADNGDLNLTDINFNLTPLLLQGQLTVSGLFDTPSYAGNFETNAFDTTGLLQTLGIFEVDNELTRPAIGSQPPLRLTFAFNGDEAQASLSNFTVALADTLLQANANIRFATDFSPANISYEISSNTIDLTPFLAQAEETPSTPLDANSTAASDDDDEQLFPGTNSPAPVAAEDTALPLAMLNQFNMLGSISIESVTTGETLFTDINLFTNLENGVLDIESQPISAFDGTILGNLRLDARGNTGNLSAALTINQVNAATITPAISRLNSVAGRLDVEGAYNATGATLNQVLNSLSGSTTFAITENSVDIGVVKQVFTAIAALSTSGEAIQQWPDVIRFQELSGYILLENGIGENQQVKLRMDNFDVTGTGGIDIADQSFHYDLLFTVLGEPFVQTIQMSPRYHDVSWPVQCNSGFDDSVTQYCRPDFTQVREIFTQIGTNEVRRRLDNVINDQIPTQLQDNARGLLRNLLN